MKRPLLIGIGASLLAVIAFIQLAPKQPSAADLIRLYYSPDGEIGEVQQRMVEGQMRLRRLNQWDVAFRGLELAATASANGADFAVRAAANVPAAAGTALRERLEAERAEIGAELALPLRTFVSVDSALSSGYRKVTVRPEQAGTPCVVSITIGEKLSGPIGSRPPDRLLGLCAFYARYGLPGRGVSAWLDSTQGQMAATDVVLASPYSKKQRLTTFLGFQWQAGWSCVSGRDAGCIAALSDAGSREARPPKAYASALRLTTLSYSYDGASLPGDLLARLREAMGERAFAELWRSDESLEQTYERVTGEPIAEFVRAQLLTEVEPRSAGPSRAGLPMGLAVVLAVAAALLALRFTARSTS